MLDIALHGGAGPVQCREIALRQDIPEPYLNQLLGALRRAQLVLSRRGPGGGHLLARAPELITLGEIVDALDGRPRAGFARNPDAGACAGLLREVWRHVDEGARVVADGITLAELADQARERALTYQI